MGQALLGIWLFTSMIYHGQSVPPLNPALKISFQFEKNGISTLYYKRDDEVGFCERKANFSLNKNQLKQTVIWVNPENSGTCGVDPDMQMGHESLTQAEIINDKLNLKFQMGEDDLFYVWERKGRN